MTSNNNSYYVPSSPSPSISLAPSPSASPYPTTSFPTYVTATMRPSISPYPTAYVAPVPYYVDSGYDAYDRQLKIRHILLIVGVVSLALVVAVGLYASKRWKHTAAPQHQQQPQQPSGEAEDGVLGERESTVEGGNNRRVMDGTSIEQDDERRAWLQQWLAPVQTVLTPANFVKTESSRHVVGDGNGDHDERAAAAAPDPTRDLSQRSITTILDHNDDKVLIPVPGLFIMHKENAEDDREQPLPLPPPQPPMRWASGTCTICLTSYQLGESVTWSSNPSCDHCFHTDCIEAWLLKKRKQNAARAAAGAAPASSRDGDSVPLCPNCRREFVQDPFEASTNDDTAVKAPPVVAVNEIDV